MKIYIKDLTKGEQYTCDLYINFLTCAKSIGFDRDQIDKLISILDSLRYSKYIDDKDIPLLKGFMNDISTISEAFFYEYDDVVEDKMLEIINKINNEIRSIKHD